jgi:dihydropyrimidine dehydrogenase (NAD+) subunit PreT
MKVKELNKRFKPLQEPVNENEAVAEAARCLFCYDPPCMNACPASINVPEFIRKILTGNFKGSAKQIYEKNYFAGGCARVCPTLELCEGACVLNDLQKRPVQIARLQRFSSDWAIKNRVDILKPGEPTGKKVAIIGAGPAGFSCAAELAILGHQPIIFDARKKAGGLFTHGIARYKLASSFTSSEIRMIKRLGIKVKQKSEIGKDIPFEELMEKYDALFIGVGLGKTASLNIPGENITGVIEGLSFVEKTCTMPLDKIKIGKRVVVIGGGNTAVDAAIAARKLGAEEVMVVYRRTVEEMPAYKKEYDMAKLDGVRFVWLATPVRILGDKKVQGIKCQRMRLGEKDASGRARPIPVKGSEFLIECDNVIMALGQVTVEDLFSKIADLNLKKGRVVVDPVTGATSILGVFAGGDCTPESGEMVNAVAGGIRAARGINNFIKE